MITFLNGLGPAFIEVEATLKAQGIVVEELDHHIQHLDGTLAKTMRLRRIADGKMHTIRYFSSDKRIAHHLLWSWCEFYDLNVEDLFGIVRA